jgi:hypothetical protein
MRGLEIVDADLAAGDVRCYREHGNPTAVTFEQAIDQVEIAGAAAARTDRKLTREMRFGAGRERRRFLVAHVDPVDALVPA